MNGLSFVSALIGKRMQANSQKETNMRSAKPLQTITTSTCHKRRFPSLGVTACGLALATGLMLSPISVDAAKPQASTLPVETPPQNLQKGGYRLGEAKVDLTDAGKALAKKYAARLAELQAEIGKELPAVSDARKQAFRDALAAQKISEVEFDLATRGYHNSYPNKVIAHQSAIEKLGEAPVKLARAEMYLKNALAMPDGDETKEIALEEAQNDVEKRKKDLEKLAADVEKARNSMESAKAGYPEAQKKLEAAAQALEAAKTKTTQALAAAGIHTILDSAKLDAKLAQATVLTEATPYWLAVYAQQGSEHEQRVERLLANTPLLIEMLVADGAVWGKYPLALEIYEAIQKAHPKSKEGLFQRLALAIALEHAVPIVEDRPVAEASEIHYVDPVARYASYEKAYLAKELDPGFETLCAWSLRMVVDGEEPDAIMAWGRDMLRGYRPDLITWPDPASRYVKAVETEINYTSKYQKLGYDRDDLQQYQNILAVGGICGRRAFFGRFILRSFGIPTTARPQQGHAALVRWTPQGWVCCLGGGWGSSNRRIFHRYPTDRDFFASTQARQNPQDFLRIKRALWISTSLGEETKFGYRDNIRLRELGNYVKQSVAEVPMPEFWQSAAMIAQNAIIDRLGVNALDAVGEDIGEANEAVLRERIAAVEIPAAERKITVDSRGVITIPTAATTVPTNNTDVIHFMPSNLGGMQLHYTRFGGSDTFEYKIDAPSAGKYRLTARLVTPAPKQHLFLKVNDADGPIDLALPYTIGMWDELKPAEIELKKGENVLAFYRGHYFMRGVTIRDFTLTPVK